MNVYTSLYDAMEEYGNIKKYYLPKLCKKNDTICCGTWCAMCHIDKKNNKILLCENRIMELGKINDTD